MLSIAKKMHTNILESCTLSIGPVEDTTTTTEDITCTTEDITCTIEDITSTTKDTYYKR